MTSPAMPPPTVTGAAPPPKEPTGPERRLRVLLLAHAAWSAVLACLYVVGGDTTTLGFLPNSFAKDALFVALSLIAAGDVRRWGWLALVIATGYLALVAGQVATLLFGGAPDMDVPLIGEVSATVALLAWMAVDLGLAVLFFLWWSAAVRAQHGLRYLHPAGFNALSALAEVVVDGPAELLTPDDVARNVDGYLANLEARGKWRVQLAFAAVALWPLLTARPPLPMLAPAARKQFLERRFLDETARLKLPAFLRRPLQTAVRTASQMAYLGYYGDDRTWDSIGYTRYAERDGATPAPAPAVPPLRSLRSPPDAASRYDAIVIGSGAAGGILAHRFAAAGRRVLVLERGPHADPRDFTDDEVGQYLWLYNEGALQLATTFTLQVLQGMCVGGGTTVNNGLCLRPPGAILDEWEAHGIDRAGLERAITDVHAWLGVRPIDVERTSQAAQRFGGAVERLQLPGRLEVMEANITAGCRGSGYCNIGCPFDARTASLNSILPWAQHDWPDRLHVLADFHVERIEHANGHATAVAGRHRGRPVTIAAGEIVIAAGAIGSSALLLRSRLGGRHVGEGLHFNINSPLTAEFPFEVDAFDGIQMSHAYVAGGEVPDYLVETWFNPPATQALATPGWFDRHYALMHRFRRLASAGVLVGTTTPGRVTDEHGAFSYEPSAADRDRVLAGLVDAARIFLEAGATCVMPATVGYRQFGPGDDLARLPDAIRRSGDLLLTSAHPQGGNAVGTVVDGDFRVDGAANVYLCDASAFPSSVRVNPQLTVMGLAEYASRRILGDALPAPVAPANAATG
jgi:choline dehydrogenase-like flavoprotein